MWFSEKVVLFCRREISERRGCFQLPGLSLTAPAEVVICLMGVDLTCAKDDMAPVDSYASSWCLFAACYRGTVCRSAQRGSVGPCDDC